MLNDIRADDYISHTHAGSYCLQVEYWWPSLAEGKYKRRKTNQPCPFTHPGWSLKLVTSYHSTHLLVLLVFNENVVDPLRQNVGHLFGVLEAVLRPHVCPSAGSNAECRENGRLQRACLLPKFGAKLSCCSRQPITSRPAHAECIPPLLIFSYMPIMILLKALRT